MIANGKESKLEGQPDCASLLGYIEVVLGMIGSRCSMRS